MTFRLAFILLAVVSVKGAETGPNLPGGYRLLYEQNFSSRRSMQDFVMTDPQAWRVGKTNDVPALELFTQSNYKPAFRSPFNIALIKDTVFTDFVLEARMLQTSKEYGHRDMCLFFGAQDPANFYYVHIATAADDHAHNVFIVKDAPRTKIAKQTTKGIDWGQGKWHRVRLERKVLDGTIKVYFDDFANPLMIAEDKTFTSGYIGFGSFDDVGMITDIKIWGPTVETKRTEFYRPSPTK